MPRATRRVVVLLLPEVHLQDMAGPVQVLHEAARLGAPYRISFCGGGPRVRSAQGLTLADLSPLPEPAPGDLVLVPGIESSALDRLKPPRGWLRTAHAAGARIASVCAGAFALARSGLLDGRRCTTHWSLIEQLRREVPRARIVEECLFIEDGGIITSAGIASGIDMALALVEEDQGPILAARVARDLVVYLRRQGGEQQRSVYLDHRTHLHPGVHRVQDWLVAHPECKPLLSELGRIAGMSPRNLTRNFRRATGISPGQFAARIKAQVSRDLLADPSQSVESIAAACGYEDARQLRRLWRKSYGMSIAAYRRSQDEP
jgi:transcriptional regulator GlxA family with amidase domain